MEPEILYYLASDKAPEVRREIVENAGTPLQADAILARDPNEDVRCELARKISRPIPDLKPGQNEKLANMAMGALSTLARDELPRVRAIVAEDLDDIVSAPILEYSPLFSGKDLLMLIASGMKSKKLAAVARRPKIDTPIVESGEAEAIQDILGNKTAEISNNAFDQISDHAQTHEQMQHLMVSRDDLPIRRSCAFHVSSMAALWKP